MRFFSIFAVAASCILAMTAASKAGGIMEAPAPPVMQSMPAPYTGGLGSNSGSYQAQSPLISAPMAAPAASPPPAPPATLPRVYPACTPRDAYGNCRGGACCN